MEQSPVIRFVGLVIVIAKLAKELQLIALHALIQQNIDISYQTNAIKFVLIDTIITNILLRVFPVRTLAKPAIIFLRQDVRLAYLLFHCLIQYALHLALPPIFPRVKRANYAKRHA
jgi:hypothetical protein